MTQIGFEVRDGVAHLELRRPEKRNAITWEMLESLLVDLDSVASRQDVRALVLRGAGGCFSAGADLSCVKDGHGVPSAAFEARFTDALTAIVDLPVPTVAAVDGPCVGGGCALAFACDVRFAAPRAFFMIPAARHGIVYEAGSIVRMADLIGPSRTARMLYAGERVDARTAERWGLVDAYGDDVDEFIAGFLAGVLLGDRDTIAATRALVRPVIGAVR
jgi:enoyl-CoA hydratase/carnithine racemase